MTGTQGKQRGARAGEWTSRVIVGSELGAAALPAWLHESYRTFRSHVMDPAYPCFFGTRAEERGEMFYAFVEGKDLNNLPAAMRTFAELAAQPQFDHNNIAVFFEPDAAPLSHAAYEALFWRTLQHLEQHDPQEDIGHEPAHPLWEFSFAGVEMFVVCATPSFQARHSRNLGPGMVLLFQPRSVFVDKLTNRVIGKQARSEVRRRLLAWDDVPAHPDLGVYGDAENREWKQYFLPDDNQLSADVCPLTLLGHGRPVAQRPVMLLTEERASAIESGMCKHVDVIVEHGATAFEAELAGRAVIGVAAVIDASIARMLSLDAVAASVADAVERSSGQAPGVVALCLETPWPAPAPASAPASASAELSAAERRSFCASAWAAQRLGDLALYERGRRIERADPVAAGETTSALIRLWQEVLSRPAIGLDESVFALGASSLEMAQIAARVHAELGIELPLRALFEAPSARMLAAYIDAARLLQGGAADARPVHALAAVPRAGLLPVSSAQARMWLLWRLDPQAAAYNIPATLRFDGALDSAALQRSFDALVARHESLRTSFVEHDGAPLQRIVPQLLLPLIIEDLSGLPTPAATRVVCERAQANAAAPFDLGRGPLWRARLLRTAEQQHYLLFCIHHSVCDGSSMNVLVAELAQLYAAAGGTEALAPLPIQYADYAAWQNAWLPSAAALAQRDYWTQRLAGHSPVLDLGFDSSRRTRSSLQGGSLRFELDPEVVQSLQTRCVELEATPFMLLLAAFEALLFRYTGERDLWVGVPNATRARPELANLIGLFVNTVVLRVALEAERGFDALVRSVKDALLEAHEHSALPFEKVVEALRPERSSAHNPLFQVMYNHERRAQSVLRGFPELAVESVAFDAGVAKFELGLNTEEDPESGRIWATFVYAGELFDSASIERMRSVFERMLACALLEPDRALSALPVLGDDELVQLRAWHEGPGLTQPAALLREAFAAQVEAQPDAIALSYAGEQLSYAELDRRSQRLARGLVARGIGADQVIGIHVERSPELVVSLLAVVQAGAAFLPLDPEQPAQRSARMLEDAGARWLLVESRSQLQTRVPSIALEQLAREDHHALPLPAAAYPEQLVSVLYTSGSTGRPKPVGTTQAGLRDRLAWMREEYAFTSANALLHKTPVTFDVATWEVFLALSSGARLAIAAPGVHREPELLAELVQREQVTAIHFVPSVLRELLAVPEAASCNSLRYLFSGGEALTPELQAQVFERLPGVRLDNRYGPTEASINVSRWTCQQGSRRPSVPIGFPLPGTRLYVLDEQLAPVAVGMPGELWIGGSGLARGYLGKAALSAERFLPDPHHSGERMYRSGDRVRRNSDGSLDYLGRSDSQIKVRGVRIELEEIEATIRALAGVSQCAVRARPSEPLVAYIEAASAGTLDSHALLEALALQLPRQLLPSQIVQLAGLPRLASGKLDRGALPEPPAQRNVYSAPRTEIERAVAEIWRTVLSVELIGRDADFFELGGHSLLAARVVARVRRELDVEIELRSVFEARRLADFAGRVEQARASGLRARDVAVERADRSRPLPLSFNQERMWFLWSLQPDSAAYNVSGGVRLTGELDRDALSLALQALVQRHEALRTTFPRVRGVPLQQIAANLEVAIVFHDFSGRSVADLAQHAASQAHRPFDLERGPLLRVSLVQLAADSHALFVTLPHIVAEGWTMDVFAREYAQLYAAFASGQASPLPPLAAQYVDYTVWQRRWLAAGEEQRQLEFWRETLGTGTQPTLQLPFDRPRPAQQSFAGDFYRFELPQALVQRLRAFNTQHGLTLFTTVHAALVALLYRVTGQQDVRVGYPVANRARPEFEELIGAFLNTQVLRCQVSSDLPVRELLERVQRAALDAQAHQDVPFHRIVEMIAPERSAAHTPLFQVICNVQRWGFQQTREIAGLALEFFPNDARSARFDLGLNVSEVDTHIEVSWTYSTDLFDRGTIERLAACWCRLLEEMLDAPQLRLRELSTLSEGERTRLLYDWNDAYSGYQDASSLHERIAQQAAATPDAIALTFEGHSVSYRELERRASALADHLLARGVAPDTFVGLLVSRSLEMLVGMLAIFKCGAGYLPLDSELPTERLSFMLEDAQVRIVLSHAPLAAALDALSVEVCALDQSETWLHARPPQRGFPAVHPENVAYCIFTSGSTGKPKGVSIAHHGAVQRLMWMVREYGLSAHDVFLQKTPLSFDVSVWELFVPLLAGARLVIAAPGDHRDPQRLEQLVQAQQISVIHFVPSMLTQFLAHPGSGTCTSLKRLFSGGEALTTELQTRALRQWPAIKLHNRYGPTETAIYVSHWNCRDDGATSIPIGWPVPDTALHILDADLNLVPIGALGEIYIGGVGLARGYLARPGLTADRFVPDPFAPDAAAGARLYRSGDLGRRRADGVIEYHGRIDEQVKVRGFRIELGEIETQLRACERVRDAVVLLRRFGQASVSLEPDARLVAYVIAQTGESLNAAELRRELLVSLPEYMVPSAFVELAKFPWTNNGKLDRAALPDPDATALAIRPYEAPRHGLESLIAQVWSELLNVPRIGRHDDFFELGGHSLMAMKLIGALQERGVAATVRDLFSAPSLHELALALERRSHELQATPPLLTLSAIPAGCEQLTPELVPLAQLSQLDLDTIVATVPGGAPNVQDIYPLSPTQEGILFHHLLAVDTDAYVFRTLLAFEERARLDAFVAALGQVIARHDILRSAICYRSLSSPVQVVHRSAQLPIEELCFAQGEDVAAAVLQRTDPRRVRLDVESAPLLRGYVAHDSQSGEWLLALLNHHLVSDHVTLALIVEEVGLILDQRAEQLATALPYRHFVEQALATPPAEHEAYFRAQLRDIDEPTAPFGVLDTQGSGVGVQEARLSLEPCVCQRIRTQARGLGVSPASLFHVAWSQVLAKCTGREDVVFGTVLSGRLQGLAQAERVLGLFINTLPLRASLGAASAVQAVRDTHANLIELVLHEHASLALAQRCSAVSAPLPLFTSILNYRHTGAGLRAGSEVVWQGVRIVAGEERTNYPITVSIDDFDADFGVVAQCVEGIDAQRVLGYVQRAVAALVDALEHEPARLLRSLVVVPAAERQQLLVAYNASEHVTQSDQGARSLPALFEAQLRARPDAIAVEHAGCALSYAALDRYATRVAGRLQALGVGPDTRVALCMERGVELIVGLLGILKAGGAYVPLDPAYPEDRLAYMCEDSQAVALVTQQSLSHASWLERFEAHARVLVESVLHDAGNAFEATPIQANDLAYVIYTSGSTGRPKGVMIEHGMVARLLAATNADFGFDARDVWSLFHSYAFDFSVWEIWGALAYGGRISIVPSLCARSPDDFYAHLCARGVTVLNQTPSAFRQLVQAQARASHKHGLRYVVFGGEALEPAICAPWFSRNPERQTRLINMYGITEITVHATYAPLAANAAASGSVIGRPLADLHMYVLDAEAEPAPLGAVGELYVAGPGVARGYLGQPALTAARFVPDPHAAVPGARMYKTGDLGRYRGDGSLEYLGRNDSQVKIRGFRIELGEIEAKLLACPGVRDAAVLARASDSLIAYVVGEAASAELRAQIARDLPDYMVPSAFVSIDALPLTANGKLDRAALPSPDASALATRTYAPPATSVESHIAEVWQAVLGVERVGRHDHFFDLGGHSLLAVAVVERLRQRALQASVRDVFEKPVLCELAGHLAAPADPSTKLSVPPNLIAAGSSQITPDALPLIALTQQEIDLVTASVPGGVQNVQDIYPLSPMQEGILFHHLLGSDSDAYVLRSVMAFESRARLDAFWAALEQVIARHDILRTGLRFHGLSQPLQVVYRQALLGCEELSFAGAVSVSEALIEATDPRRVRIDVERAPLLRGYVAYDPATREWMLSLLAHHAVCDHVTLAFISREIQDILHGRLEQLSPVVPYRNFIAQALAVPREQYEAYFRRELGDVDEPTLPFGVRDVQSDGGQLLESTLELGSEESARIRSTARRHGVSPAVLFHVAWAQVLARCSGREDVVFGTVLSGRLQGFEDSGRVLGMFINSLPVRVTLAERGVLQAVRETHARLSELVLHENASLAMAQRCSAVAAPQPLFTALLNYRHSGSAFGQRSALEAWEGMRVALSEERTNYPISLDVDDFGELFSVTAQCVPEVDAARVAGYVATAISSLSEWLEREPERPAHALVVLSKAERRALLELSSSTQIAYPSERLLHELIEAQVLRDSRALAIDDGVQRLTYGELNRRANQLAYYLRELGVAPDARVAVCSERGASAVIALLAVLKAGAAYLPLDPAYPLERSAFMLADSAPVVALCDRAGRAALAEHKLSIPTLDVLSDAKRWRNQPESDPSTRAIGLGAAHLAYVIYTSGSTGQPKGVMIEHRALVHYTFEALRQFALTSDDVVLQQNSLNFDLSLEEIAPALAAGATLAPRSEPFGYAAVAADAALTVVHLTAAHFHALVGQWREHPQRARALLARVRLINVTGDAVSPAKLAQWSELSLPGTRLINTYGPTEATISCSASYLRAGASVSIGKPFANTPIYILDERGALLPLGAAGELYIGGPQVARGYLNRAELTAERFREDPFARAGARMYKTGDLARWRRDGELEFLGRNDAQVKVRGFRVELGEIETRLQACSGVRDAVVLARSASLGNGDKRLVGYVVPEAGAELSEASLRAQLSALLPDYMLPSAFVTLSAFPLTPNGKLARNLLPEPELQQAAFVEPSSAAERALASIWQDVLSVPRVGASDSFFQLGGDSILSIRVVSRAREAGFGLKVRDLFQHETLAELARVAQPLQDPSTGREALPATPLQSWLLDRAATAQPCWELRLDDMITTQIDADALAAAVRAVVAQHAALSSDCQRAANGGWQITTLPARSGDALLSRHRVGGDAELSEVLGAARGALCDAGAPRLRVLWIEREGSHVLWLLVHRAVADAQACCIIARDLQQAYGQLQRGERLQLTATGSSFASFAGAIGGAGADRAPEHVSQRPVHDERASVVETVQLSRSRTQLLLSDARAAYRLLPNELLLAGLARVLCRQRQRDAVLIEVFGSARELPPLGLDLQRTVGRLTTAAWLQYGPELGSDAAALSAAIKAVKEHTRSGLQRSAAYLSLCFVRPETSEQRPSATFFGLQEPIAPIEPESSWERQLHQEREHDLPVHGRLCVMAWLEAGALQVRFSDIARSSRKALQALAADFVEDLEALLEHCSAEGTGGLTPSDIIGGNLEQRDLDALLDDLALEIS